LLFDKAVGRAAREIEETAWHQIVDRRSGISAVLAVSRRTRWGRLGSWWSHELSTTSSSSSEA